MGFTGVNFYFNDEASELYGLQMYDWGSPQDVGGVFASSGSPIEERIKRRHRTLSYGIEYSKPLEFNIVFGASIEKIEGNQPFDRWDLAQIASWLTGHEDCKWLVIEQPDMEAVRYHCRITELKYETVGWTPWAFSAKVTCDSPFAYTPQEMFSWRSQGSLDVSLFSKSTFNGYYYPKLQIRLTGGDSVSIINHCADSRAMTFSNLPGGAALTINIDGENGVITNNLGINLYEHFNFNFFRLVRGENKLTITGNCRIDVICEFPLNVGG